MRSRRAPSQLPIHAESAAAVIALVALAHSEAQAQAVALVAREAAATHHHHHHHHSSPPPRAASGRAGAGGGALGMALSTRPSSGAALLSSPFKGHVPAGEGLG